MSRSDAWHLGAETLRAGVQFALFSVPLVPGGSYSVGLSPQVKGPQTTHDRYVASVRNKPCCFKSLTLEFLLQQNLARSEVKLKPLSMILIIFYNLTSTFQPHFKLFLSPHPTLQTNCCSWYALPCFLASIICSSTSAFNSACPKPTSPSLDFHKHNIWIIFLFISEFLIYISYVLCLPGISCQRLCLNQLGIHL